MFCFACLHRIQKIVVGKEEMAVSKSIKYLYTEVISGFTGSMASFGNVCNQQEENTTFF